MMRICYVTKPEGKELLGSPQSLLNLIKAERGIGQINVTAVCNKENYILDVLRETGVDCSVVRGAGVLLPENPSLTQVVKSTLKYPYIYMHINDGVRYIKEKRIDMVHINDLACSPTLAYSALKLKVPYIYHIREFVQEDQGSRFIRPKESLRLLHNAAEVIAISEAVRKKWEPIIERPVRVVYNGLPYDGNYVERQDLLSDPKIRLLIVGKVEPYKGQMEAVRAVEQLVCNGHDSFRLTIVGYRGIKPCERELVNYVQSRNLGKYIKIKDFTWELAPIRKQHDVGLLCSRQEAFGRVTIENMLAGLLMVGTNSGATPELIKNGETGFLYTPGDVQGLCHVMLKIEAEKKKSQEIAKAGQRYARDNFLIENTAKNVFRIYQEIISRGGVERSLVFVAIQIYDRIEQFIIFSCAMLAIGGVAHG